MFIYNTQNMLQIANHMSIRTVRTVQKISFIETTVSSVLSVVISRSRMSNYGV